MFYKTKFLKKINSVVKYLILSDIFIIGGFGLIAPIFAVYINDNIPGATLEVIGIAETIFFLARSLAQIPVGRIVDNTKGENDDFWSLLIGSALISATPLLYLVMETPMHLYLTQLFYGIGSAIALPTWLAIFARHLDKNHEGVEWSIYETLKDLSTAVSAAVGGFIAYRFGFDLLFIVISILSFMGTLFIFKIRSSMRSGRVIDFF